MKNNLSVQLAKSARNNVDGLYLPLPTGIYIVVVQTENGIHRQKIIVR